LNALIDRSNAPMTLVRRVLPADPQHFTNR